MNPSKIISEETVCRLVALPDNISVDQSKKQSSEETSCGLVVSVDYKYIYKQTSLKQRSEETSCGLVVRVDYKYIYKQTSLKQRSEETSVNLVHSSTIVVSQSRVTVYDSLWADYKVIGCIYSI